MRPKRRAGSSAVGGLLDSPNWSLDSELEIDWLDGTLYIPNSSNIK